MLFIVGASGKLGSATLHALLEHHLVPADQVVCTTSSDQGEEKLTPSRQAGVQIRRANWDDSVEHWAVVLQGCTKLLLISSSRIEKDFGQPHPDNGRETDHLQVLEAAVQVGVPHVYYTSLAFQNPSKSRVMTAHERTERWLKQAPLRYTLIREGLYNESWPLYFGHYDIGKDTRDEITVAGDSKISWTSISDLGLATALILTDASQEWAGRTLYLSQERAFSLGDVASMASKATGRQSHLKVVSREEHEKYYVKERGMNEGMVLWWSRTYDALADHECEIHDPTLESLLKRKGIEPTSMEDTVSQMLA